MRNRVKAFMEQHCMCSRGMRMIVGVSGGADSICLLHVLYSLQEQEEWILEVVHVHHGLRGEEADRDCAFVEMFCQERQIPFHAVYKDVRKEAEERGLGEEETGRLLRYEAFRQIADGDCIAVAHNQDDQGETMLMQLCRGTGLGGLAGMRPLNHDILRPLLFVSREEIETYCRTEGLGYCQDSTNGEDIYTRNRVRNRVMPLLRELNPQAHLHMAQTAELLAQDEDYIHEQVKQALLETTKRTSAFEVVLSAKKLSILHPAIRKRVLKQAVTMLSGGKDISAKHMDSLQALLSKESGKRCHLPRNTTAEYRYGELVIGREQDEEEAFCERLPFLGEVCIERRYEIMCILVSEREKNQKIDKDVYTNVFDYDKILKANKELCCRTWKTGDNIDTGNGHKKIKDFFIDEKIPRTQRKEMVFIALDEDIVWIVGKRISAAYRADKDTRRWLEIRIRRITKK